MDTMSDICLPNHDPDRGVATIEFAEATEQAERLARGPTNAYGHVRRPLRQRHASTWETQPRADRDATIDCPRSADTRDGIEAFADRRALRFGPSR